ncbi:lytic transglycosylase domain-containing protein [Sphingopyxis sp. P1IMeth2]|uniref:lytic transglycosylase domain-containing protein n=1 Tax=Sphingopyxis sp. P1IMeth2 TaxID=1892848 RepID=UPI0021B2F2CB|nr:lytic transglycosylase domain-containing protein [Sphingopyxis sp. P1IMeth2]
MTANRLYRISIVVAVFALSPASAAFANTKSADGEARIAQCIRAAAGGRQWLERTLWGLRDQEGGWIGAEVRNSDGSHDLGPLQVNSWWVGKIASVTGRSPVLIRWWLANDACFNVDAARWIFLSGLHATGDYWKAIGTYHSPTLWRQRRYANAVSEHLRRRFGASIFHWRAGVTGSSPIFNATSKD